MDPMRAALTSWWLALVAIWVVQEAHGGQHELHELPPLLHALRDAALAVPLAAAAVVVAGVLLAPLFDPIEDRTYRGLGQGPRLRWVLLVVVLFAIFSIPGHELHGALFGVEQSEVGWVAHALLDASIAAFGAALALIPVALVVGPPIRRAATEPEADPEAATRLRPIPVTTGRSER
jgi:hypothetical protein